MIKRLLRLSLCLAFFALMWATLQGVLTFAGVGQGSGEGFSSMSTLDRDLEPVIVDHVFSGVPIDQLFVYRESGGTAEQIPFQIDEVTAAGLYTDTEDGVMDANDEVVFMAQDLGEKSTTISTVTLPISSTWYEVEVRDPLDPAKNGWAYVVRSNVLTPTSSANYADYISASQRVSATNYAVGWATGHAGLDYQSLFGGADILDRTKLRVSYTLIDQTRWTEDDLPVPPLNLIKDGPVRVIVSRGAATTFAYASYLQTITEIDFTMIPGTLDEFRMSTDLTNTITGTYYNENAPGGLTIDGSPEAAPTTLSNPWRQISLGSGTVVQVVDLGAVGGTQYHYYKDDSDFDANDTGDGLSYGDSGVRIIWPAYKAFSVDSVQYMLPGEQGNRGNEYYGYFGSPLLTIVTRYPELPKVYLPVVLRE